MKTMALLITFIASSSMGLYFSYMLVEREQQLRALHDFFKYLQMKISSRSGELYLIIKEYDAPICIEMYIHNILKKLKTGNRRPFYAETKSLYALDDNDIAYIRSIEIGGLIHSEQIDVLNSIIAYLDMRISEMKENVPKRKAVSLSGILVGLAIVIVFI